MPKYASLDIDIWSENFDAWLADVLNKLSVEQRTRIPGLLFSKMHKKGRLEVQFLTFLEKLFVTSVVLNKPWTLSISADTGGINQETFSMLEKKGFNNYDILQKQQLETFFVMADTVLMKSMGYLSHVLNSDIFNLVKNYRLQGAYKNKRHDEVTGSYQEMLQFLITYEGNKKLLAQKFRISIPQWYALLFFSQGERNVIDFYESSFRFAASGSKHQLRVSLYALEKQGLVEKRKTTKTKYWLTTKGQQYVNEILSTVFLNY